MAEHVERRTEDGKAGVVRNGHLPARKLQTGLGPVTVKIPKVRAKTGEPVTFRSALVPPYVRKTKSLEAALAWLYLKGIFSGEIGEALKVLVVPDATGLSAGRVSRLKQVSAEEYRSGCEERLDKGHWVYVWADGVYSGQRAEQTKLCALVAIGDGAMGFRAALEEVYPETRQQRCWMHKTMNVLNCLPRSAQPKAQQALHNIWQSETQADAEKAFDLFIKTYEPKYPEAAICLHKDREELMAFYRVTACYT